MSMSTIVTKIEESNTREFKIYEILGKYGDRIPKDVQAELRTDAENQKKETNKLTNKLKKQL